jgi:hypothetical protein
VSATTHVTIWCDCDDCSRWTDHGRRTATETRRLARNLGWVRKSGQDFCCQEHSEGRLTSDEQEHEDWLAKRTD